MLLSPYRSFVRLSRPLHRIRAVSVSPSAPLRLSLCSAHEQRTVDLSVDRKAKGHYRLRRPKRQNPTKYSLYRSHSDRDTDFGDRERDFGDRERDFGDRERDFGYRDREMKREADHFSAEESDAVPEKRTRARDEDQPKLERYPKRKVAMLVGFVGTNYQGMQINEDCDSVEKYLKDAFVKSGAIAEFNADKLQKVSYMRCARTDKGVHALGQVVSFKMQMKEESTIVERINSFLPNDIRVFGYTRVANSFNSKNHCSNRVYQYMLPASALNPSPRHPRANEPVNLDELFHKVEDAWRRFEGSHNFHNFTSKKLPDDPSNQRYMISCTCTREDLQGEPYLRFTVRGQSFMFNQIRKMIGLVVCIARDGVENDLIEGSLTMKQVRLHIAPGHGLLLRACDFHGFDNTRGKGKEPITFEDLQADVEKFKEEVVYPEILRLEKESDAFKKWLTEVDEFPLNYDEFLRSSVNPSLRL